MLACKECGEVRTISKTYKAAAVIYTLRYFMCKHPPRNNKGAATGVTTPSPR